MKKLVLLLIVLSISIGMFAGFVPRKDAEKAAKSHTYQSLGAFKAVEWDNLKMNCIFDPSQNDIFNFYVFNFNGDEGYVVVSSDDKIIPILAYSFEGGFNHDNMSPAQAEFLEYFESCINFAASHEMEVSEKLATEWTDLVSFYPGKEFKQKSTSPNLLKNINWNQGSPYNAQCPADEDATSTGGHVPVGCVATAMLQVMKYYNWPPTGTGSKYHSNSSNGGYGTITINFATQTYDWYSIPNQASQQVNTELGKINYHASVGVSMRWGPDGSGSQTSKIVTALKTYFRYATTCAYVEKSDYSDTDWKNLIKAQIDSKKPVVYSGSNNIPWPNGSGHAWNCDGYQDDSYHMNWGWGGAGNGYYTLDNLTSTATPSGPENNFNVGQEMIINIYPGTGYPGYCSGLKLITGTEGGFGDGSSTSDYEPNQSCVYVIDPVCGDVVSVNFLDFDLGDGDNVEVYDGDENSNILLATFDNENLPGTSTTSGSKGALTIRFNTNGTSQADGWNASYEVKNCKSNILKTTPTGTFTDGSGICDYSNSSFCSWIIEPEGASYITIEFDEFDLVGSDYVKVFKDALGTANLLHTFKDNAIPSGSITIPSGKAVIQFYSNSSDVAGGFTLSYTSSTSDIESNKLMSNMSVMPNPGNLNSQLVLTLAGNTETKIFVTNMLGEIVAVKQFNLIEGVNEFNLSQIFDGAPQSGIYFINVDSGKEIKTQKFVVL